MPPVKKRMKIFLKKTKGIWVCNNSILPKRNIYFLAYLINLGGLEIRL